jgi:hypothetical protein
MALKNKSTVVHSLQPHNPLATLHLCNRYLQSIDDGELDPNQHLFSDEAWFYLNGHVNTHKKQAMESRKFTFMHGIPLHAVEVYVCCVLSAKSITGSVFYGDTIHSGRYCKHFSGN